MISRRAALRLAGGAVATGLAGCLGASTGVDLESDWPMLAHDPANTGSTRARGPGEPEERWSVETDPIGSSPAVVDGTVYVGGMLDGAVYALDCGTGEERWTHSVEGAIPFTPTVSEDTIYVVTPGGPDRDGRVYAITTDGTEEWHTSVADRVVSGCTVVDRTIYLSTIRGDLLALDAASGDEMWREPGGGHRCTPAVVDGTVYSFGPGMVGGGHAGVALDAATGEEQWRYDWDGEGALPWHAPAVGDGAVYVGSGGQDLLALDVTSGEERWLVDLEGFVTQPPVVAGDVLYVGVTRTSSYPDPTYENGGGNVVAVDADTGEELWRSPTEGYGAAVALGSETLYSRTLGGIATLDVASGETIWTHDAEFGPPWEDFDSASNSFDIVAGTSQPAVVDGTLFVTSPAGGVYAVGEA